MPLGCILKWSPNAQITVRIDLKIEVFGPENPIIDPLGENGGPAKDVILEDVNPNFGIPQSQNAVFGGSSDTNPVSTGPCCRR